MSRSTQSERDSLPANPPVDRRAGARGVWGLWGWITTGLRQVSPTFWRRYVLLALILAVSLVTWNPVLLVLFGGPALVTFTRDGSARALALWCAYVVTFVAFVYLRMFADDLGPPAVSDYAVMADSWLTGGTLPTVLLQRAFYQPGSPHWWDWLAVGIYQTHYFCVPIIGLLVWRFRPAFLSRYLLSISVAYWIGLAIHWILPTIPPWLASINGDLPMLYRPMWDLVVGMAPEVYRTGVQALDRNTVAAMPSMHVAAAVIVTCGAWSGPWWVRVLGILYPVLMTLTLVYFAEHYVIDAIVGALLVLGSWQWISRRVDREGRSAGVPEAVDR